MKNSGTSYISDKLDKLQGQTYLQPACKDQSYHILYPILTV